jgi:HIV Tat-specific factor 1
VKAAKAVKADIKPVDRELAAFQAEMSALGATAEPVAAEDASLPDLAPQRADTPPPDERRFEDDDGTIFVWDGLLRRFVEEVCACFGTAWFHQHNPPGHACMHAPLLHDDCAPHVCKCG